MKSSKSAVGVLLLVVAAFLLSGFTDDKAKSLLAKWDVPDSVTGIQVAEFCEALDRMDEAYFRDYLTRALSPAFLTAKPVDEHWEQFKQLHKKIGKLELLGVKKTGPTSAEVTLRSKNSGKRFKANLGFDPAAEFRLASLSVKAVGGYGLKTDSDAQCTTADQSKSCCAPKND